MLQNGHSHSKNIFWPQVDTTFGTRVPVVPFGTHMAPLGANMDPVGTPIFDSEDGHPFQYLSRWPWIELATVESQVQTR